MSARRKLLIALAVGIALEILAWHVALPRAIKADGRNPLTPMLAFPVPFLVIHLIPKPGWTLLVLLLVQFPVYGGSMAGHGSKGVSRRLACGWPPTTRCSEPAAP